MSLQLSSGNLYKLKNVMHLRVTRAHRAYSDKLVEWKILKQEVDNIQNQVDVLQHELDKVAAYKEQIKNDGDSTARKSVSDRRHWLIYDQDLAIYNLESAQFDLKEATDLLNTYKAEWIRAQHRETTISEQGEESLARETLMQEELQESEIEDLHIAGGSGK